MQGRGFFLIPHFRVEPDQVGMKKAGPYCAHKSGYGRSLPFIVLEPIT